jgi:hypothetical protein
MKSGVTCRKIVGLTASSQLRHLSSTGMYTSVNPNQIQHRIFNTRPKRKQARRTARVIWTSRPKVVHTCSISGYEDWGCTE